MAERHQVRLRQNATRSCSQCDWCLQCIQRKSSQRQKHEAWLAARLQCGDERHAVVGEFDLQLLPV